MINLKILLIITKGEVGGAQVSVYNLAKGLKQKGHNVTVAFGKGNFLENKLKTEKINLVNFKNLLRTNNIFKNFLFLFEIKKFLDNNKFDIAHFNSANALFGAVGAKLSRNKPKTIFTVHGLSVLDKNYKTSFLIKKLYYLFFKIFLKFIDKTIFVSQANLQEACAQKITKRGQVIYNGLGALSFLEKTVARQALSKFCQIDLNDSFLIGSVGRLAFPKNYSFLINIFPEIKKIKPLAKIVIIGSGPEKKIIQQLIQELNFEKDIYLINAQEMAVQYLLAFDVFVLPSVYEGLPITLLEARQANIPILASDVGGNREILLDDKFLFTVNDAHDFLKKFIALPATPYNYPLNSNFSLDKMIKEYLKIYQS